MIILKIANDFLFLHLIVHYYAFVIVSILSPDWFIFCHMIISHINSPGFLFIFCFSLTKGQRSKR